MKYSVKIDFSFLYDLPAKHKSIFAKLQSKYLVHPTVIAQHDFLL